MYDDENEDTLLSLFRPDEVDCGSWLPVEWGRSGVLLDFCAVCGMPRADHPAAAIAATSDAAQE